MKILVIGPDFFNIVGNVGTALTHLGHDVRVLQFKNFADQCGYLVKKAHKFGVDYFAQSYVNRVNTDIKEAATDLQPDLCLILNGELIRSQTLEWLRAREVKLGLILIDSILRLPQCEENLAYFDKIFSFDPRDEKYILDKHGLSCGYFHAFFDPEMYFPVDGVEQDIDISFIGTPTANRLQILDGVANYAAHTGCKFLVFGRYWNERYFWKKNKFVKEHPALIGFVNNGIIQPPVVAQVYRRSKICLNIHISEHQGINGRTFEILGTRSFEMVDHKKNISNLLQIGEDLITYESTEILIERLNEYLSREGIRKEIAYHGYETARKSFTIEKVFEHILAKM